MSEAPRGSATAWLVPLEPGLYAFALTAGAEPRQGGTAPDAPAVHVCAAPGGNGAVEIVDGGGQPRTWLGFAEMLFVTSAQRGAAALVTAYFPAGAGAGGPPPILQVRALDTPAPGLTMALRSVPGAASDAEAPFAPTPSSLEIVANMTGGGEFRLIDPEWVGNPDGAEPAGAAIESFTLLPRDPVAAAGIEYKGLTASGAETSWLPAGSPCGMSGGGALIGFAIRQRPGADPGMLFDCEYSGRFRSGATSGPTRNGAPCLSRAAADPLQAIQVRISARPPR
jgi:hypothetical protein